MIAAAKPLSLTKATSMVRPTQAIRRAAVVVRAVESPAAVQEEEQAMPATYTYGGQTYSEAEVRGLPMLLGVLNPAHHQRRRLPHGA
jgi:hypothetical protein